MGRGKSSSAFLRQGHRAWGKREGGMEGGREGRKERTKEGRKEQAGSKEGRKEEEKEKEGKCSTGLCPSWGAQINVRVPA